MLTDAGLEPAQTLTGSPVPLSQLMLSRVTSSCFWALPKILMMKPLDVVKVRMQAQVPTYTRVMFVW